MRFVCDAAGQKTWFRIETEAEAARESELMRHAVEKHFRRAYEQASQSYRPAPGPFVEQDIGRGAHIGRAMPVFLTLRDGDGKALATALLPPPQRMAGRGQPCPVPDGRRPRERRPLPGARGRHPGSRPALRPRPRPGPLLPLRPALNGDRPIGPASPKPRTWAQGSGGRDRRSDPARAGGESAQAATQPALNGSVSPGPGRERH